MKRTPRLACIRWVSLIIYKQLSVAEVLAELKKLRRIEMSSGRTFLTEITMKQRTILEKLNIPIPKNT